MEVIELNKNELLNTLTKILTKAKEKKERFFIFIFFLMHSL